MRQRGLFLGEDTADEINLHERMGFSGELLEDYGPSSPNSYQLWLREARAANVPAGEFWFYVNQLLPSSEVLTVEGVR